MRPVSEIDGEIVQVTLRLRKLREERKATRRRPPHAVEALRLDFVAGMKWKDMLAKHKVSSNTLCRFARHGEWRKQVRRRIGQPPRIKGEKLTDMRAQFETNLDKRVSDIAASFGISTTCMHRYAVRNGWARNKVNLRQMTEKQRHIYRKMKPCLGKTAATAEAWR